MNGSVEDPLVVPGVVVPEVRLPDPKFEARWDEASKGDPFSNYELGAAWTGAWCDNCTRDQAYRAGTSDTGCPLLLIAFCNMTPAEWLRVPNPETAADAYRCTEFSPIEVSQDQSS